MRGRAYTRTALPGLVFRSLRPHERNTQHVGRSRRAEWHAGDDDHALARFGEPVLAGEAARTFHHVIEIMGVLRHDAVHAPDQREPPPGGEPR